MKAIKNEKWNKALKGSPFIYITDGIAYLLSKGGNWLKIYFMAYGTDGLGTL